MTTLPPLRKSVEVGVSPDVAFQVFTEGLDRWWPKARHSVSGDRADSCGMEPRVGGEVYELRDDGKRFSWGRILTWEPPRRLVMSWHPGRIASQAQEVELRFVPVDGGTRVELEHRGWEALGADAELARERYEGGWDGVLAGEFAGFCEGRRE